MKRDGLTVLFPVHHSLGGLSRTPRNMERVTISVEQREALTKIALDIFADCVNSGVRFQDALLAIYLSGLQHSQAITNERKAA